MTVSIVTCPDCGTTLLSDTVQCPKCQRVLDPERAADLPTAPVESTLEPAATEEPCPRCGEMVRRGLVRCYNCGTFMRKDVARVFKKMQEEESPIIYSPMSEEAAPPTAASQTSLGQEEIATDDDDFILAPGFVMQPGQPSSPRSPQPLVSRADEETGDEETYSLSSPPVREMSAEPIMPMEDAAEDSAPKPEAVPPKAKAERPAAAAPPSAETSQSHSVATGGDALLNIALQEEREGAGRPSRRGGRRLPVGDGTSVLVHCVCGVRIRVQDRHRGMLGHCPKCKTPFIVPPKSLLAQAPAPADITSELPTDAAAPQGEAVAAGAFERWLTDIAVHRLNPQKLRLKPGSLKGDFQEMDCGFSTEGLLLLTLAKKGGSLFGGAGKKKGATREAALTHLREGRAVDDMPVPDKKFFAADTLAQLTVVQPMPYAHESMFGGVPVFGEGRIAVRLPKIDEGPELLFASFELSGFRQFATALRDVCGIDNLGLEQGVPLEDEFTELTCHYTDEKLQAIQHVEFYQADPAYKLQLIGRRCQECGLVVSEDARKKEKIGGANGRGIAKAKCPKCEKPFGDISLYTLAAAEKPAEEAAAK